MSSRAPSGVAQPVRRATRPSTASSKSVGTLSPNSHPVRAGALRAARATAYWTMSPGNGALRDEPQREPGHGEALVRALHSGISRGTETLVHQGRVPQGVADQMRAPFQDGDFSGPVKYGYLSVGVVERGPDDLVGRNVFCLFPHQDRYVVPADPL